MEQTGLDSFTGAIEWRWRTKNQHRSRKSIHFDFQSDKDNIKGTPIMSEDKPWMKFLKDLPKNFGDTTNGYALTLCVLLPTLLTPHGMKIRLMIPFS